MRLIDADKFIDYINAGHLRNPSEICFSENDVLNMLDKQPTVNVVNAFSDKFDKARNEMLNECGLKLDTVFMMRGFNRAVDALKVNK